MREMFNKKEKNYTKVTNWSQMHSWYKLEGIICLPIEDSVLWSSCLMRAVPLIFFT